MNHDNPHAPFGRWIQPQSSHDMKTASRQPRLALLVLVVVGLAAGGALLWKHAHEGHRHDASHETHAALSLDNGKRWKADAPLQTGMQRIRNAATPVLAAHAQGRLSPDAAKHLSASVQESATFLMQNCRLEPKADATLHVFLTDLLRGAALLAENPSSVEGASLMSESLRRYPDYFEHPGWVPVAGSKDR